MRIRRTKLELIYDYLKIINQYKNSGIVQLTLTMKSNTTGSMLKEIMHQLEKQKIIQIKHHKNTIKYFITPFGITMLAKIKALLMYKKEIENLLGENNGNQS